MKLTKKLEKEIRQVYEAFWKSLLDANIQQYTAALSNDYRLIGTTEKEVFFSRKEAILFLKKTGEQLAGNIERRKTKIKVEAIESLVLITEQCDAYARIENEWTFYAKTRVSSWMQQKPQGWKIVQQHFSFPDAKAEDGQTIGLEKISKENIELREAIKRRTIELEDKNQELKIETSLEKVRAMALGMRKPEDLPNVCETLYQELQILGFTQLRNAMVNIHNDETKTFVNYDYSDTIGKSITPLFYDIHPVIKKQIKKIRSADDAFSVTVFKGKDLASWKDFRRSRGEKEDKRIKNSTALYYYFYSIGTGSIGISTFQAIPKEKQELLKRFRNVFAFAYRRYMDVAQAEAQAKEAQIELALERVRARTMGMQKSEELKEVIQIVFEQFVHLKINLDHAGFVVDYKPKGDWHFWIADKQEIPSKITHPYFDSVWAKQFNEAKEKGEDFFVTHLNFKEKNKFYQNLFKYVPGLPEASKEFYFKSSSFDATTALLDHVALYIENFSGTVYTDEENKTLMRFAKVFEQTYTRFLDLQKAEDQAREAQIETALERIRSSAMAMHSSEGILDVTQVLREQIAMLGEKELESILVHIYHEHTDQYEAWYSYRYPENTEKQIINGKQLLSWSQTARARKDKEKYHEGESEYTIVADYKMLKEWYEYLFEIIPEVVEVNADGRPMVPDVLYYNYSKIASGTLVLITNSEASNHSKYLLNRAAQVFNLAYSRFLDLQKAEAQAREAQIEAALEKVRSRSLAMHKSEELEQVILVVSEQLQQLQFKFSNVSFGFDTEQMGSNFWLASPQLAKPFLIKVPYIDNPAFNRPIQARKNGIDFNADILSKEENRQFLQHMFDFSDLNHIPAESKSFLLNTPGFARSQSLMKNTILTVGNYTPTPYNQEQNAIIKRFGNVFEQAYTRFLDLQKAEAQAREAQIEAALERTRTQSMIMQHSSELDDILRVFHQQVLLLGIPSAFSFLWLPDEDKDRHIFWAAWAENNSTDFRSKAINYPLDRNEPATAQCLIDWKSNEPVVSYLVPPAGVVNYFASWSELIAGVKELKPENFIDGLYYVEAFMKYGCFGVMVKNELKEDEKKILARITIEFERAYTRFLDLQKAEAQAREAQIEAGLERFRSRMLGMQKSSELEETTSVMYQQLNSLGVVPDGAFVYIVIIDRKTDTAIQWIVSDNSLMIPPKGESRVPMNEHPQLIKTYEAWKRKEPILIRDICGGELEDFKNYVKNLPSFQRVKSEIDLWPDRLVWSEASFTNGTLGLIYATPLPQETLDILVRFSKVFDLTYTRFLDIRNAEEQTREAKIEAALEKIRSRSLAMQKSEELKHVVKVLLIQLQDLNFAIDGAAFLATIPEGTKDIDIWIGDDHAEYPSCFKTSYYNAPSINDILACRESESDFFSRTYSFEEKNSWFEYAFEHTDYKMLPDQLKKWILEQDSLTQSCAMQKHSMIMVHFHHDRILSESEVEVLKRFSRVFEQTYTRFQDLQKAEAQAREAQIEAALERVRSRTMAMQHSDELSEAAFVLFQQLNLLGVAHERINIGIVNPQTDSIDFWITEQGGNQIKTRFTGSIHEPTTLAKAYHTWKSGEKSLVIDLYGEELESWLKYLTEVIKIPFDRSYQRERRVQTCGFFSKGMLVVTTPEPLAKEAIYLLEKFAGVFDLTYTRFSDLKMAEAHALQAEQDLIAIKEAKQNAERALTELKSTQSQLIQSEKMASLGELTAGIAHEIQNPLNFVNNFSEVSTELVDEMNEELQKGNTEDAKQIAADLKQNLEKINHHGKRAGDIVKGMLQHSRTNSGTKEPTDINALADEYLRLAYHGLRAKDKSFNAKFETEFDSSLEKINVVPQDIGRVILNLITNAFYVVNEKAKLQASNYHPQVVVSTKKLDDKIEIRVKDNGNGITDSIKEKIFQPFFTTKPTGQGTGLGLSLSYDIVKAHGGELKVETKEGEGTIFSILLRL